MQPARDPSRSSLGASALLVRLLVAAVLAGTGTVMLLAGLGSVGRPEAGDPSGPGAVVSSATPGAPAEESADPESPAAPSSVQPVPSGDPVLVGAGDIADCDRTEDEETAAIVERTPGYVFTLGDNVYDDGTDAEFRDCFGPSWGRFKDRITLPAPGNHDHETAGAAGYRAYFGAAAVPDGQTWYARDVGAWHVVVLDSTCRRVEGGCDEDSPQVTWLIDDLRTSRARCTLALFHHPLFSSGDHGNIEGVRPFWDALYADGADLVLNGHDHDYERFAPQDPAGNADEARGITQVVVGTGGANLREFKDPVPNGIVRSSAAHGVLVLTLGQSGWTYRFESTDGTFTDQGSGTCH